MSSFQDDIKPVEVPTQLIRRDKFVQQNNLERKCNPIPAVAITPRSL
jgi:hypothetical protein